MHAAGLPVLSDRLIVRIVRCRALIAGLLEEVAEQIAHLEQQPVASNLRDLGMKLIVDAIVAGDEQRARDRMAAHLRWVIAGAGLDPATF